MSNNGFENVLGPPQSLRVKAWGGDFVVVEDVSIRGRGEEAKKSIHSICDYIDYMSPEPLAACALPASNREYPELLTLRGHGNQRSSRGIALWMLIHLIQCLTLPSATI
ncbi:uncharacterized protein CIMG_12669 [Coccidioides immitis RS]|uniref:Uncharacterized protein n=1 Tax=Coccidioides immitis (strain RS) TaxID=246410 RepID=A0A0D8JRL8_COCIM|nr:uncharacterized protein CIMG_12669 [Coccidioides immitis RS]KJF60000.1 hypothetical protein CIMG_12669 [Coccidioides immitis RS]TPX24839.1 hypothetical protein DIZ76_010283 [Coccidioides immitis]